MSCLSRTFHCIAQSCILTLGLLGTAHAQTTLVEPTTYGSWSRARVFTI